MSTHIRVGDCRTVLRAMADESVQCIVTSPPYFGLRDYCVGGQIGLEPTPDAYVAELVVVFREARRVLRKDGTLWLNLGDSYAASRTYQVPQTNGTAGHDYGVSNASRVPDGLKPKDLIGIPWRVAFALQADGWWLRSSIIWAKPNPMPESVTDRPTSAHENIFLLSRGEKYYYDAEAVREPAIGLNDHDLTGTGYAAPGQSRQTGSRAKGNAKTFRGGVYTGGRAFDNGGTMERDSHGNVPNESGSRNLRNVWSIATQPYGEAHFATFPPALIEPCIKAGCPAGGTVLDPFFGAGTTGLVADRLGRHCIGIELNPAYAAMAQRRIEGDAGLFAEVGLHSFGMLSTLGGQGDAA